MSMKQAALKRPLGKGLSELLGPELTSEGEELRYIPSSIISVSRHQPRTYFDDQALAELATSIKEVGILQPLVVRKANDDTYELIAGERRLRASLLAGLTEVPVIVKDFNEKTAFEATLIENIQRSDLTPIEEAVGYQQFIEQYGYTQDQLSDIVGKSRSYIANTIRLLNLPEKIRQYVHDGLISPGHARALLSSDNPENLVEQILEKKLNVRQTEAMAKKKPGSKLPTVPTGEVQDDDIVSIQQHLSTILGSKVFIHINGHKGQIHVEFQSLEELDDIITKLSKAVDPNIRSA